MTVHCAYTCRIKSTVIGRLTDTWHPSPVNYIPAYDAPAPPMLKNIFVSSMSCSLAITTGYNVLDRLSWVSNEEGLPPPAHAT